MSTAADVGAMVGARVVLASCANDEVGGVNDEAVVAFIVSEVELDADLGDVRAGVAVVREGESLRTPIKIETDVTFERPLECREVLTTSVEFWSLEAA